MKHAKEDNNDSNKKSKIKHKMLWVELSILVIIIAITITIAVLMYRYTNTEEYANKKMIELVTKYYERDIKENAVGVNRLIVTLQTLEDAGFEIKGVKGKPGVSEDLTKAYSYIIIENPNETHKDKIIYTIENHLNGE